MTLENLIAKFLQSCRRKDASANTLRNYRSRLQQLQEELGRDRVYASIDREELLDYLYRVNHWPADHPARANQEKSASTQRLNIIVLQLLQRYAADFHDLPPILKKQDLEKPAVGTRERIATAEEVQQILDLARPDWKRLYQALRLTGARPGELVSALIERIDPPGPPYVGAVMLIDKHKTARKTGKPRKIPIGNHVAPIITESIGDRQQGWIFLDDQERQWNVPRASRIFRKIRQQLQLPSEIVFYSTRHEFGSKVATSCGINTAKELLGHTDIKTTQRYVHLSPQQLQQGQEAAFAD